MKDVLQVTEDEVDLFPPEDYHPFANPRIVVNELVVLHARVHVHVQNRDHHRAPAVQRVQTHTIQKIIVDVDAHVPDH